jgi:RNA polymerase sigma-70 factor (ECF subfamily)
MTRPPPGGAVVTRTTTGSEREHRHLLSRIAAGDEEAMRQFNALYRARLASFLRPIASRTELIDEIVNDTLFLVWRCAARFRGESSVSTWVMGIARNQGLKRSQREWRRAALYSAPADFTEASAEDDVELHDWLGYALATLPDEQRAAIELAYIGGYSCEEIATIMQCPVNTVKTRMFHARSKLRSAFVAAEGVAQAADA